jgi:hypothetical protein
MSDKRGYGLSPADRSAVSVSVVAALGFAAAGLGLAAGAAALGAGALATAAARRAARPPLRGADVERDAEGRIMNWPAVLRVVQQGGVAPELRAELWPLLLGVFLPSAGSAEREKEAARLRLVYSRLVLLCERLDGELERARRAAAGVPPPPPPPPGASPLRSPRREALSFAEAHRVIVVDVVRTDLRAHPADRPGFEGGTWGAGAGGAASSSNGGGGAASANGSGAAAPTVTVLPVGDGLPELMLADAPEPPPAAAVAAGRLPLWRSAAAGAAIAGAAHAPPPARRAMLRLANLLSAYAVHDPGTGYCQGMSDLAAPFVQLLGDDALAFACFERLMRRARRCLQRDHEAGVRAELDALGRALAETDPALWARLRALGAADCAFAYRMVVVLLRRELPLGEALTLWEAGWALEAADALDAAGGGGGGGGGGAPAPRAAAGLLSPAGGRASTVASMDAAARAAAAAGAPSGTPARRGGGASAAAAAGPPPPDFLLQFVAAAVRAQRARVLHECADADDVLRLFNGARVDFWPALAAARRQHRAYAQGAAVLRWL